MDGTGKTIIYWFSGTGNSLYLAKAIAEGLGDAELVHVARAVESGPVFSDRIGLVFPVYSWGPPVVVTRLISMLPTEVPSYVFAAATCGGAPGSTMAITRRMLARRGLPLHASWAVTMVGNYPPFGGAPGVEKQERALAEAGKEIPSIVKGIVEGATGDFGRRNLFFSGLGRMLYPMFSRHVHEAAAKFHADDRCTSCGVCARVCPVRNIEVPRGGKPAWLDHCQQCYACFHWCPEEAVQYGKKSAGQNRYHHPGVGLREMMVNGDGEVRVSPESVAEPGTAEGPSG